MKARFLRGMHLLEAHRPEAAIGEFSAALAEDPRDPAPHLGIAACHVALGRWDAAAESARRAMEIDPTASTPYATLAEVEIQRERWKDAEDHAAEALRIDPWDADHHALLGRTFAGRNRWKEALAAADEGLAADAEHESCSNLRALALLNLDQRDAAAVAAEETLRFAPESAATHVVRGMAALHEGRARKAREHFEEALRLDPSNEAARGGLVVALKATWPLYRWWIAFGLWFSRLGWKAQAGVVFGGFVLVRVLRTLARRNPALEPWFLPVISVYVFFVVVSWIADPLGNVLLRFHPAGRHALTPDQTREATLVAALLASGVGFGIWAFCDGPSAALMSAAVACGLVLAVVAFHARPRGTKVRLAFGIWGGLLATAGIVSIALRSLAPPGEDGSLLRSFSSLAFVAFLLGAVATTWVASGAEILSGRPRD